MKQVLTTTGTSDDVNMLGDSNLSVTYTITGISGSVVVQVEGTQDNINYVNLDENGSTSLNADGTYGFNIVSGTFTNITVSYQFTGE